MDNSSAWLGFYVGHTNLSHESLPSPKHPIHIPLHVSASSSISLRTEIFRSDLRIHHNTLVSGLFRVCLSSRSSNEYTTSIISSTYCIEISASEPLWPLVTSLRISTLFVKNEKSNRALQLVYFTSPNQLRQTLLVPPSSCDSTRH